MHLTKQALHSILPRQLTPSPSALPYPPTPRYVDCTDGMEMLQMKRRLYSILSCSATLSTCLRTVNASKPNSPMRSRREPSDKRNNPNNPTQGTIDALLAEPKCYHMLHSGVRQAPTDPNTSFPPMQLNPLHPATEPQYQAREGHRFSLPLLSSNPSKPPKPPSPTHAVQTPPSANTPETRQPASCKASSAPRRAAPRRCQPRYPVAVGPVEPPVPH